MDISIIFFTEIIFFVFLFTKFSNRYEDFSLFLFSILFSVDLFCSNVISIVLKHLKYVHILYDTSESNKKQNYFNLSNSNVAEAKKKKNK